MPIDKTLRLNQKREVVMNDLFDRTDEELVALYAEGNNGAFDVLLKRHQVRTFNYIYYIVKDKELANDIFQETLSRLS